MIKMSTRKHLKPFFSGYQKSLKVAKPSKLRMLRAILNGITSVIRHPGLFLLTLVALGLQTLIVLLTADFWVDSLGRMLELNPISSGGDFTLISSILQGYFSVFLTGLLIVSVILGIQISLMITLAHVLKQARDGKKATFFEGVSFALSQVPNVVLTVLFAWMLVVILVVWIFLLGSVIAFNVWVGLLLLLLTFLVVFYLNLKCFFTFSFWGVQNVHLKSGIVESFQFVSKHWIGTIFFFILMGLSTTVLGLMNQSIQGLDDVAFLVVQVIFNALVTVVILTSVNAYVITETSDKSSSVKEVVSKSKRRAAVKNA